jgi:3-hydroxyisobutyrate dehydrogenase
VAVFNRTTSRARRWVDEHGGRMAASPAEAAAGAAVVCTCVGDDDDVRAVVEGPDGALVGMAPGSLLVDHTTASASLARDLHATTAELGIDFCDAPVSGGQAGAEAGRLAVMVGGDPGPVERARPVMEAYGSAVTHVGPPGSGQLTKMVNQLCIAGILQGLAEGLELGRRAGLDLDTVLEVVGAGAAGSWQLENRGPTMARGEFDFGFAVDWMRKDLAICLDEGRAQGASLPLAALVDQFYARVQARGGGRWDTSSLIELLRHP